METAPRRHVEDLECVGVDLVLVLPAREEGQVAPRRRSDGAPRNAEVRSADAGPRGIEHVDGGLTFRNRLTVSMGNSARCQDGWAAELVGRPGGRGEALT